MRRTLINMYGITETTVHVTYRPLSMADLEQSHSSPIGEPIADLSWYLLDGALNPVPQGCIGELYVGRCRSGAGLSEPCRPDRHALHSRPVRPQSGGRLYRTGDLARYRGDGVIEYIGRIDHQVKIRGFRIELGEIEAQLLKHADVREAVVLAQSTASAASNWSPTWIAANEVLRRRSAGRTARAIKAQLNARPAGLHGSGAPVVP